MSIKTKTESVYERLVDEEDARVCKAIDENACKVVPGNFILTIISYFFNKLADSTANTKIILPWVMQSLNVPVFLISFLVPIRESGSLIPQLLIAAYIRKMPIRKNIWVLGAFVQAFCMIGIAITAYTLDGLVAGCLIIFLLVLFSLGRGLGSVAAKDVIGKTIPKTRRGVLNGWSGSASGLLIVLLGIYFLVNGEKPFEASNFAILLSLAGLFWIIAGVIYFRIKEFPGETDGGGNAAIVAIKKLGILKTDKPFRNFVISRALFLCSVLSAPFYVLLAQNHLESQIYLLGLFILSSGLASLLSATIWGKFSDVSSRKVMIIAASITVILGIVVFVIDKYFNNLLSIAWLMPFLYFILTIGYEGVRIGRKTYLVDLAGGNKRTDYVAVSNTLIGIVLLFSGFVGVLSELFGISGVILLLSLLGAIGVLLSMKLPEIE